MRKVLATLAPALACAATAGAQPIDRATQPARHYATGSASLHGSLTVVDLGSPFGSVVQVGAGAVGRVVTAGGLAIELGVGTSLSSGQFRDPSSGTTLSTTSGGLSVSGGLGWAFALGDRVALTPMLFASASTSFADGPGTGAGTPEHAWGLELPLTVYLSPRVFLEPVLAAQRYDGPFAGTTLVLGERFGVTF